MTTNCVSHRSSNCFVSLFVEYLTVVPSVDTTSSLFDLFDKKVNKCRVQLEFKPVSDRLQKRFITVPTFIIVVPFIKLGRS